MKISATKIALFFVLLTAPCAAQEWPAKPVRIIAPFAAGGASDNLGRLIAEALSKTFNQQFFIDNRGGAAGMIGSAAVASADPDGYTLLVLATHLMSWHQYFMETLHMTA